MSEERIAKERMTVAQVLAERTLLRKKLEQKQRLEVMPVFCIANKASETRIQGVEKSRYINTMKSEFQSYMDNLARLNGIEAAIAKYNAETDVEIGGVTYKVSEAIAFKLYGVIYYQGLLDNMKTQYTNEKNKATRINIDIEDKSARYMADNFGTKEKGTDDYEAERQRYIKNNEYEVVDPLNIRDEIDKLEKFIHNFTVNCDTVLSIANATHEIDIFY